MNPQAGIVLAMVFGLWIAYLVPHRLRTRQDMLDARTQDRFSADLRVVRAARVALPEPAHGASATALLKSPTAALPPVVEVARAMQQTNAGVELARQTAAERSKRAAQLANRAAGRKRRGVLLAVLVLASIGTWTGFALAKWPVVAAVIPTLLAGALLWAGHRASVAARAADAAWEARQSAPARPTTRVVSEMVRPSVTGRAAHPSEQLTEFIMERPVERDVATSGHGIPALIPTSEISAVHRPTVWVPKPVPAPSYTMKAAAVRARLAPLQFGADGMLVPSGAADDAAQADADSQGARGYADAPLIDETAASVADVLSEPDAITTGSLDLNDILARRRASGM